MTNEMSGRVLSAEYQRQSTASLWGMLLRSGFSCAFRDERSIGV